MPRTKRKTDIELDIEEQAIEDWLPDTIEALPVSKNLKEDVNFSKEAAANYLRKEAKINIRLSRFDVENLRRLAVRKGLPYQTLITGILHEYVTHHVAA
jgi:predicted DNA binding CopG/RHH family protein